MNPHRYNIVVSLKEIDGQSLYEGRVLEFPDVRVYEPGYKEAYDQVASVIEDLIELANELGHKIPERIDEGLETYSGKMTFRPGKALHRKIAEAARQDELSQNQFLCNVVSYSLAEQRVSKSVLPRVDQIYELLQHREKHMMVLLTEGRRHSGAGAHIVSPGSGLPDVTSGTATVGFSVYGFESRDENPNEDVPMNLFYGDLGNLGHGQG